MTPALRRIWSLIGITALLLGVACASNAPTSSGGAAPASSANSATSGGSTTSAPAAAQSARTTPTKLVLGKTGAGAELQFWPVYAATVQGYFAQEGLEVEMTTVPAAYTLSQALIAGDIQLAGFTVLSMAAAVGAGAPLKLVAASQELPSIRVVVAPTVNSWADLKGKAISSGNTKGDYFDVVMRMVLATNGLRDDDYTMRTLPGTARLPALEAGQVAAALLSDYDTTLALQRGYKSFGFVHEYVKDVVYSGILVDASWASANEATLVSYLRALNRGVNWLFDPANREAAVRIFMSQGPELTVEQADALYEQAVNQKMLSRTLRPSLVGIENILRMAHEQDALPVIPPLDTWIDLSYLDKATR